MLDARWSRPVPPKTLGKQVDGKTILGLGRRGKYLLLGLDGDQTLVMHLRMTGNLVLVEAGGGDPRPLRGPPPLPGRAHHRGEAPARPLRARRRPRGLVHRPAPLRRGLPDRRREAAGALLPARGRAALARVHAGEAGGDRGGQEGAAEVVPARPVGDRRGRQHLRRRGALPGAPAPAVAGRVDETRALGWRCATASSRRWKRGSTPAAPRSTTTATGAARRAGCRSASSSTPARAEPCPGEDCDGVVERIVVSGRSTYFCPSCQVKLRKRPKRRKAAASAFAVSRNSRGEVGRTHPVRPVRPASLS